MIYIKKAIIQDFKNFTNEVVFEFDKNINIIRGINGCGKTTVLDAIIWCLTGRLFNGSVNGWKPKSLYVDSDGNATSKVKDLFNTLVEVTISFDDGQKDILIKRTSCCGKSTVLYYNNICDTQKQINKYLQDALGFDLSKLLIFTNPEILFNSSEVSQSECGELIYDSVYKRVQTELADLYQHLFDNYEEVTNLLEDNTIEKALAKRILTGVKRQFNSKISENEIIEDLQSKIDENIQILDAKNETIKSQELILEDYYQKQKQEETYKKLEQSLDQAEQQLRQKLYLKAEAKKQFNEISSNKDQLVIWLHDFNELLKTNPSIEEIKKAFGIGVTSDKKDNQKINILKVNVQKIKCPFCGSYYTPLSQKDTQNLQQQAQSNDFDYLPKLKAIKEQISSYALQLDKIQDQIEKIDFELCALEYKTIDELQSSRNTVSKFFASLEQGKTILKQVNTMKQNCEECNINNKYLNILLENIKLYVKQKLKIITDKLNDNLTSGFLQLYKIQANGTIKQSITIVDKYSNATYAETNQSNKIKLGIEVCKLLQDFNGINFPIFVDEVGRFSDYSFIKNLGHQIIATLPTLDKPLLVTKE